MKTLINAAAVSALALAASQSMAYDLGGGFDASANIGVASNYMWRGMTQTRNGMALQGGVDLTHSSGFYLGTWMSNVDFKLAPGADTEQDIYGGYGFKIGNDVSVDLKYTDVHYKSESDLDFSEYHAQVSAYGFAIGGDYSNDMPVIGTSTGTWDSSSSFHYYGSYTYTLPADVTFTGTLGHFDYKDKGWIGGEKSAYNYYVLALNKTIWDINFGLSYSNTDVDSDNCKVFAGGSDYCGNVFALTAVKTFK